MLSELLSGLGAGVTHTPGSNLDLSGNHFLCLSMPPVWVPRNKLLRKSTQHRSTQILLKFLFSCTLRVEHPSLELVIGF